MSDEETPWSLLKRLKAAGASAEVAISALRGRGLSSQDLKLLIDGSPEMEAWISGASLPELPPDESFVSRAAKAAVPTHQVNAPRGNPGLPNLPASGNFKRWIGLTASLGIAVGGFVWSDWDMGKLLMGLVAGAIAVAVWLATRQEQFPGIPEVLRQPVEVFELDGVQFSVFVPRRQTLGLGHSFEVVLFVQNAVLAPRTLVVALHGRTPLISSPLERRLELEPGVVAEVAIPFRLRSLDDGWLDFDVALAVISGSDGRRLRKRKGEEYVSVSDAAKSNALGIAKLALLGEVDFILGANGRFSVKFDTELPAEHDECAVRIVPRFSPTAAQLGG